MESIPIELLVKLLRSNELVVRTGLWLIPVTWNITETSLAARFNMDAIDMRLVWLDQLPTGVRMVGLRRDRLLEIVGNIADQYNQSDCVLLYNLDLFLSGITPEDRKAFWYHSFKGFPHKARALLYLFPTEAYKLLIDPDNRILWEGSGRMTITE